jgi:hypothetical protein
VVQARSLHTGGIRGKSMRKAVTEGTARFKLERGAGAVELLWAKSLQRA